MASSYTKLDQALKDLLEAYNEIEGEIEEKHGDDEDAFSHAMIEILETSVESAIDETDGSTGQFASILATLSEALEQLDPSAFDEDESFASDDEDEEIEIDDADDLDDEYDEELEEEDEDDED